MRATCRNSASDGKHPPVRRVALLLGTRVDISIYGQPAGRARSTIDTAFREVERIHALMSFHRPDSDVSRLNRSCATPVQVDARTVDVLRTAALLAERSAGAFDVTVAPTLVACGWLPQPVSATDPDVAANWRDIEILADDTVRLRRPTWLDLGGIAKGYAVDRAFAICADGGGECMVNAGGDARVSDGIDSLVSLQVPGHRADTTPRVELSGGSIASSCGAASIAQGGSAAATHVGPHCDGRDHSPVAPQRFAAVLARDCMLADALTKVALLGGDTAARVLDACGASAMVHSPGAGWHALPAASVASAPAHPTYT